LLRLNPSPVIELNRAVALALRDGEQAGLVEIDRLLAAGELEGYHLAHAARADLLRRLGRREQAAAAYRQALALAQQGPDRQFLQKRLEELGA
ncbi:MAG: RNA polymerase subunit sigma-24, partial [Pseudomonas sp.]|nr:RNA polymerase subunit sigma-24 [Pseudomonas sp.]